MKLDKKSLVLIFFEIIKTYILKVINEHEASAILQNIMINGSHHLYKIFFKKSLCVTDPRGCQSHLFFNRFATFKGEVKGR